MQSITRFVLISAIFTIASDIALAGEVYVQTNLVSDGSVPFTKTDPNLLGSWGLSYSTTSPFWVSDQAANFNGSGAASVYRVNAATPTTSTASVLTVGVANQNNAPPNPNQTNGPTGQVNTSAPGISTVSGNFTVGSSNAAFIFANLDGSISGWNGGPKSTIEATVANASYTGLAIGNLPGAGGAAQLYAANQISGNIDVFNSNWKMTGSFTDPNAGSFPAGYGAFNVQNLSVGGKQTIFVTFVNQGTSGGIVDEFNTDGTFIKTLVSDTAGTHLNAPWGLTIAPVGWGQFGGDLLVGNNNPDTDGLTRINAYNLTTGAFDGTLTLNTGQPFSETQLWAISFGNGAAAGSTNTLYFTAGLDNNTGGLFGAISAVPEPSSGVLGLIAVGIAAGSWKWKNRGRRGMAA